jgi:hypothetical protein
MKRNSMTARQQQRGQERALPQRHTFEEQLFLGKVEPAALLGSINIPHKFMPWKTPSWAGRKKSAAAGPAISNLSFYTSGRRRRQQPGTFNFDIPKPH